MKTFDEWYDDPATLVELPLSFLRTPDTRAVAEEAYEAGSRSREPAHSSVVATPASHDRRQGGAVSAKKRQSKLRPCPFCGGVGVPHGPNIGGFCYIECEDCGAETEWVTNIRKAISRWNRRTPETP